MPPVSAQDIRKHLEGIRADVGEKSAKVNELEAEWKPSLQEMISQVQAGTPECAGVQIKLMQNLARVGQC